MIKLAKKVKATSQAVKKLLKFGKGNSKLSGFIATFSLPAGYSCPCAQDCLSKSHRITGRITDGPLMQFRCFAAMGEARATNVRNARWFNSDLLQDTYKNGGIEAVVKLIVDSIPLWATAVRIHVSGDFFSEWYLQAWVKVAQKMPKILFYTYTKSLQFWVNNAHTFPDNFRLTASVGGRQNDLIAKHNLKFAKVVFSEQEANDLGLEIDHDDSHAMKGNKSFALLLHGAQKANTPAGEAWKVIKRTIGGYSRHGRINNHLKTTTIPVDK